MPYDSMFLFQKRSLRLIVATLGKDGKFPLLMGLSERDRLFNNNLVGSWPPLAVAAFQF